MQGSWGQNSWGQNSWEGSWIVASWRIGLGLGLWAGLWAGLWTTPAGAFVRLTEPCFNQDNWPIVAQASCLQISPGGQEPGQGRRLGDEGINPPESEFSVDPALIAQPSVGVEVLERILHQAQTQGNLRREFESRRSLADAYKDLGNYRRANELYDENLTFIAANVANLNQEPLIVLIDNYRLLGDMEAAIAICQDYLARSPQQRTQVEANGFEAQRGVYEMQLALGRIYRDQGNYDQAIAQYQEALDFAQRNIHSHGITLALIGDIYNLQGNYDRAIAFKRQALALYDDGTYPGLNQPQILEDLGMNLFLANRPREAETTLKAAVQAYEGLGQFFSYEPSVDVHRWLQQVLVANQKLDEALEIAERGRGRLLANLLGRRLGERPELMDLPSLAQIKRVARERQATLVQYSVIYGYDSNHGGIMWGYDVLEAEAIYIWVVQPNGQVSLRSIDPRQVFPEDLTRVVEQTRRNTEAGRRGAGINLSATVGQTQTVLEVEGRSGSTPIAANPTVNSTTNSPANPAANPSGTTSRPTRFTSRRIVTPTTIATATPRRLSPHLQRLHQLLIEPIADLLPEDPEDRVILMPQDALFAVPFAALQDEAGAYLIERHTLTTAPSAQILDLTGQLKQRQLNTSQGDNPAHPALVVGNPDPMPAYGFPPVTLSSLPGAAQEATTIATLLDTEALIGAQATKSAVLQRMAQAPIIHLATHGLLNGAAIDTNARPGDQPTLEFRRLEGSLALAPEPSNDGFLTAEEIQNLRLTADLVVLSACDTGRGIVRGNGVMGLSSAFLQAGVPSVVVSLWQVPDEATAQLMERFYQALQDNPDKAAALRQAMIQSIGEFPHPRDWSAFLLIGEP